MEEILKIESKLFERAFQICKDEHKAKDAVQETFLWAIENQDYSPVTVMNMLIKLALKQLNFKEVFIPASGNDEDYETITSGYARVVEQKTAITPAEIKEKVTQYTIDPSLLIKKRDDKRSGTFLNYKAAVVYMSTTGITRKREFRQWIKTGKPSFIPALPHKYYKKEYTTMEAFLGGQKYYTYEEALSWTKANCSKLGISGQLAWVKYRPHLPSKMPKDPQATYKNKGWVDWATFLHKVVKGRGANRKNNNFYSYEDAKKWVLTNLVPKGINTTPKFHKVATDLPKFIPTNPNVAYKDKGWNGWSKFFENGFDNIHQEVYTAKEFWPYKEAREWVRLNLRIEGVTSFRKWRDYITNPTNPPIPAGIPKDPFSIYKLRGGWKNWSDFLGTFNESNAEIHKRFPTYPQLRSWLKENMLGRKVNSRDWTKWRRGEYDNNPNWPKLPFPVPSLPSVTYKKHWKGWAELTKFKDKENRLIPGLSDATRTIERMINDKTIDCNGPELSRRQGTSIINVLKKRNIEFSFFLPYDDAEQFVQTVLGSTGINNFVTYRNASEGGKLPLFLPVNPQTYYKGKGWVDGDTFFGKGKNLTRTRINRRYSSTKSTRRAATKLPFKEARQWVRDNLVSLGINGQIPFKRYDNLPLFIPRCPSTYYSTEWKGWPDWFGREAILPKRWEKVLGVSEKYTIFATV